MNRLPPSIAELTAGFLNRTEDAEVLAAAADALGEVEPHEVSVGFRAEPRLAWKESQEVLTAFGRKATAVPAPSDWGTLVARQEGAAALPFVLGNYPQRVRDLSTLLQTSDLSELLKASETNTPASSGLLKWGTKHIEAGDLPQALIAAANYRAAGDFELASETVSQLKGRVGEEWRAILANEEAGILWHRGQFAAAAEMWAQLPDSVPVRFNRGLAALFLGKPAEAKTHLQAAVANLPESSAWHHLASLYLTLAEMRG